MDLGMEFRKFFQDVLKRLQKYLKKPFRLKKRNNNAGSNNHQGTDHHLPQLLEMLGQITGFVRERWRGHGVHYSKGKTARRSFLPKPPDGLIPTLTRM